MPTRIQLSTILEKFVRYTGFDTQSNPVSVTNPSTEKQLTLANYLAEELRAMGISTVSVDEFGYVMATIPANTTQQTPAIGFIAHMDTAPDMSGAGIRPQIVEKYDGNDIVLNKEKNIVLRTADFPEIKQYVGQTIVTTDGTTLLGADDKAGIAAIMCAAAYLVAHPEIKHGAVQIAFTPDEEIGRGAEHFDLQKFGADYAYTLDGGELGELEYENFNAAEAFVTIAGNGIHPGYAKGKMKNALNIAHEFHAALPVAERPEATDQREGFFHLTALNGTEEQATLHYIIRDFDRENFEQRKVQIENIADTLNKQYGNQTISLRLKDQYYNMYEKIISQFHIVEKAREAILKAGVEPLIRAARGGTDGARLSFMGLPCPNIFAGGHNFHGKYEYLPIESTLKAAEVILNIVELPQAK